MSNFNSYYPAPNGYAPPSNRGYNGTPPYPQQIPFPPPAQNLVPQTQPPPPVPQRPAQFPTPQGQAPPPPQQYQQPRRTVAPANRSSRAVTIASNFRRFLANEEIMVNLQARGWVMGIVLATVQFFETVAGFGYKVRFTPPGEAEQEGVFPDDPNFVQAPRAPRYN
ncbi:hypothetical protein Hypma_006526 [Hypsizygus marmoreus]|uniref:Uncharacterized protein n=1 Tax=Hypsizygus marmoreus TaxID=39966 RepID=A0A369K1E2_HYPMA|nr:hypothetical protein Hypma_006526 [Hypsizygus marmoreus]